MNGEKQVQANGKKKADNFLEEIIKEEKGFTGEKDQRGTSKKARRACATLSMRDTAL